MEFKGTKDLQVDLNHNQVLDDNGILVIANVNDFEGEGKYNTLLFSKSPEMLEMLIEVSNQGYEFCMWRKLDELIKQATTLQND